MCLQAFIFGIDFEGFGKSAYLHFRNFIEYPIIFITLVEPLRFDIDFEESYKLVSKHSFLGPILKV